MDSVAPVRSRRRQPSVAPPLFGWAALLSLFVLYGSLFPFDVYWPADLGQRWRQLWLPDVGGFDAVANLLLFVPYGLLPALMTRTVRRERWQQLAVLALVVAVLAQLGQLFIRGRDPHLFDVIWNVAGFALGAYLGRDLIEQLARLWSALSSFLQQRLSARGHAGLLPATIIAVLLCEWWPYRFASELNVIRWLPFEAFLADDALLNLGDLVWQLLLAGSLLVAAHVRDGNWRAATRWTLLVVVAKELGQLFVAGAQPDLTPVLLVPVLALLLHDLDQRARASQAISSASVSSKAGVRWPLVLLFTVLAALALKALLRLPGLPYNVVELFNPGLLAPISFALLLLAMTAGPGLLALRPRGARMVAPLLLLQIGSFLLLQQAVTQESLRDILGTALLQQHWQLGGFAGDLLATVEYALRFIALTQPVFVTMLCALRQYSGPRGGLRDLLGVLLLLVPAYGFLRAYPGTDNLVELLDADAAFGLGGVVHLYLLLPVLALPIARLRYRLMPWPALLLTLLCLPLAALLGWQLLQAALMPQLRYDGQVFSALQFLLGANRGDSLSDAALLQRWLLLFVLLVGGAAVALLTVRRGAPVTMSQPVPRFAGFAGRD